MTGDEFFSEAERLNKKGNSILNKIFGLPAQEDIDAQKELMDYQQKLAEKAWEYNSPVNQMQRLRDAGLNPDLAIGGSPQNVVEPASNNTPQFHSGSTAVPAMVNSLSNAALVSSQAEKNLADADLAKSKSKNVDVDTEFNKDTFMLRYNTLQAGLGLTNSEIKKNQEILNVYQANVEQALASVRYTNKLIEIGDWEQVKAMYDAKKSVETYDIMRKYNARYDGFLDLQMKEMVSSIGLNDATASKVRAEAKFLWSTFEERVNQLAWSTFAIQQKGFLDREMQKYYSSSVDMLATEMKYYPMKIFGTICNDPSLMKTDKEGNIIFGKDGMPQLRHGYIVTKNAFDFAREGVGIIKDGAIAFGAIRYGAVGAVGSSNKDMQYSGSYYNQPEEYLDYGDVVKYANEHYSKRKTDSKLNDLWESFYKSAPGSKERAQIYKKIVNYKTD